jgi:hypothetical protein
MIRFKLDDILGGLCIAIMVFGAPYALAIAQAVLQ